MKRFLAAHYALVIGVSLSLIGMALALHLSSEADRRQTELIEFERQWQQKDRLWMDSTNVQAARNDSLLKDIIGRLEETN